MEDHIQNEWKLWAYPNPGFGLHRFESFRIQNLLGVLESRVLGFSSLGLKAWGLGFWDLGIGFTIHTGLG